MEVFDEMRGGPKAWAMIGMVPIVLGAAVLLGFVAWSSGSLIRVCCAMSCVDIGLFGYWWTGSAGEFTAHDLGNAVSDRLLLTTCTVFAIALLVMLLGARRLNRIRVSIPLRVYHAMQLVSSLNQS